LDQKAGAWEFALEPPKIRYLKARATPVVKRPTGSTIRDMHPHQKPYPKRRTGRTLVGLIVSVAVVGLTGCGEERSEPIQLDATTTTSTDETATNETSPVITIVLDGWSMAGISRGSVTWSEGSGKQTPVQWVAAEEADVRAIAAVRPDVLTRLAARMYSADPALTCNLEQCQDSTGEIGYGDLVDPTKGKVHGAIYSAWGIRTGAWIAKIPAETALLWFGAQQLFITRETDKPDFAPDVERAAGEIIALAISFGALHPIAPAWLDGATPTVTEFGSVDVDETGKYAYNAVPAESFLVGVHSEVPGAANLGASRLTWMTSPTTGCGAGVLCVPGVAKSEIEAGEVTAELVCFETYTGVLETGTIRVSYVYPQITHQFGIWGDTQPSIITESGIPLWNTTPPYVSGPLQLIFTYAHLYDQKGIYSKVGEVRELASEAAGGEAKVWFAGWGQC